MFMEEKRIFSQLANLHYCYICDHCLIVDRDMGRSTPGHKCRNCNQPGNGSMGYFNVSVYEMLSLMENFYNLETKEFSQEFNEYIPNKNIHHISFIIFFCSLAEILLTNFLNHYFDKENLSKKIRYRLLDDNILTKQKIDKLFPSLIGKKWKDAVKIINEKSKFDYKKTLDFHNRVVKIRNELIHHGSSWLIPDEMPLDCLRNVIPLVQLFIDLHNEFIAIKNV